MSDLTDALQDLAKSLAETTAQDGINTGSAFWNRLKGDDGRIERAKATLARCGVHQLNAVREPDRADEHRQSAAHDINALMSIGAATQIEARREARNFVNRLVARMLDASEAAIDLIL